VATLLRINDLPNPDLLDVGDIILLPETPVDFTPATILLPDARLVRSPGAAEFDTASFLAGQGGQLARLRADVQHRDATGSVSSRELSAAEMLEQVARDFSVDVRIILAILEWAAGLLSADEASDELLRYPLLPPSAGTGNRPGFYRQLNWLADQLNRGYYGWKYRGETILEFPDGRRWQYDPSLNAATVALQYALAQFLDGEAWLRAIGEGGLLQTYIELYGDPFPASSPTVPPDLQQPPLTLPFARGEVWRFTGGFHGGWGNGSAWAAVDFAPPAEDSPVPACYTASFPVTALADGIIASMDDGRIVLDLDGDGDEGSGWTILYLHLSAHAALRSGQRVAAGNILGYPSCQGGVSYATHLHIARRYNGEWLPADCNRCPAGRSVPPFVMSGWKVVGLNADLLSSELYQGYLVNLSDNRNVIAEQGRDTTINEISW